MTCSAISVTNPLWDQTQDLSSVIQDLRQGKVIAIESMRDYLVGQGKTARFKGNVNVGIIQTTNGRQVKFALKSYPNQKGMHSRYPFAEEAAYNLNQFLFLNGSNRSYIPPTVSREFGPTTTASVSYFLESVHDLFKPPQFNHAFKKLDPIDLANAQALITILPHTDPHPGNWIAAVDKNSGIRPVIIDTETFADLTINPSSYQARPWSFCTFSNRLDPDQSTIEHFVHFDYSEIKRSLFQNSPRLTLPFFDNIYNHLRRSSFFYRQVLIQHQSLWVRYFQDDPYAFPHAPTKLPQETIEAYRALLRDDALTRVCGPLIETKNTTFDTRQSQYFIQSTATRIETMLGHVTPMERETIPTPASS